jgi:hypothetical protein
VKIGIVRVLDHKVATFFFKPLDDAQKIIGLPIFSFSTKVGITFYVPSQSVFRVKISDWVRWKGIDISKNNKIKNKQQQYFSIFFLLEKRPF